MIEITRDHANDLLDCGLLTDKQVNYLSKEMYSSRGCGCVYIKSERNYNAMINRAMKPCENCGEKNFLKDLYSYVDESNEAITKNSPNLCKNCFSVQYKEIGR